MVRRNEGVFELMVMHAHRLATEKTDPSARPGVVLLLAEHGGGYGESNYLA
ncbi:hypothetical protein SAMN05216428_11288 [Nitrosospira sp. Nsp11]|nr:hypothetical protein SAMN05216428_11288 [Nitrosospira sp. Nsp11]